jgi:osmotically-inducible protein OsmY
VEYGLPRDIPVPVPQFEPRENFAGRGPRGYTRSDERIRDDICEILTRHPEIDATDIDITVDHGVVTLAGTVEDRYTKRLAADVAELTLGVHEVENRLRIA